MNMKLKVMSMVISLLLSATAAHADMHHGKFHGEAQLATAVAQPSEATIKGITWHCESSRCTASAEDWPGLDSFVKQCRVVAADLGPLTSFRSGGRVASKSELNTCNQSANPSATQLASTAKK
jgi:hypothetical protein